MIKRPDATVTSCVRDFFFFFLDRLPQNPEEDLPQRANPPSHRRHGRPAEHRGHPGLTGQGAPGLGCRDGRQRGQVPQGTQDSQAVRWDKKTGRCNQREFVCPMYILIYVRTALGVGKPNAFYCTVGLNVY